MSPIRMARNIVIKNCAIRKEGARRRRGGAGVLSGPVGIVLLDWCRKIYKSDLSLIFFCILDEAAQEDCLFFHVNRLLKVYLTLTSLSVESRRLLLYSGDFPLT